MNLRQLAHLLAVAETKSFQRACEVVHLSEAALHRSIKALEDEFGVQLLERRYGRATLTTSSKPIAERARKLLAEAEELKELVRRVKGVEEGELRIGFSPFTAAIALYSILKEVTSRFPMLRMAIEVTHTDFLMERLRQDRLDVVIGDYRASAESNDISIVRLERQKTAFVVSNRHPLVDDPPATELSQLNGFSTGSVAWGREFRNSVDMLGFPHWPTVVCDDLAQILRLANESNLIAIVPEWLASRGDLSPGLVMLPIKIAAHSYPGVMSLKTRVLGPAGDFLEDLIKQQFGKPQERS